MGQNSEKWSRRSRWVNRTQTEDRNQDMREFVQNELTDHILQQEVLKEFVMNLLMVSQIRARKTERIRDELVDGSKIGAREHKRIHGEVPDETKVDDDVTDQSVNQSRATEKRKAGTRVAAGTLDPSKGTVVWKLQKSLYGLRSAPRRWSRSSRSAASSRTCMALACGPTPRSEYHSYSMWTTCCWLERTRSSKKSSLN